MNSPGVKSRWCEPWTDVEGGPDQRMLMIIEAAAPRLPRLSDGKIAFG